MRLLILAIFALLVGCETAPQQYQAPLSQKEQCYKNIKDRYNSCLISCLTEGFKNRTSSDKCSQGCDDRKDAMQDRCNRM
jgi:hypothetical protein